MSKEGGEPGGRAGEAAGGSWLSLVEARRAKVNAQTTESAEPVTPVAKGRAGGENKRQMSEDGRRSSVQLIAASYVGILSGLFPTGFLRSQE